MNKTPNYALNQWEADDRVQRVYFNADNAKIDAALFSLSGRVDKVRTDGLKIVTGSYVGTGTYGEQARRTLDFRALGRVPQLFILQSYSGELIVRLRDESAQGVFTWSGYQVTICGQFGYNSYNDEGETYRYFALG